MSIQQIYPQEPLNDPLNAELWLVRHGETEWPGACDTPASPIFL